MQSRKNLKILEFDINESKSEFFQFADFQIGFFIARDKEKKTYNEDALFLISDKSGLVFGVCDGAGGHPLGQEAAQSVAKYFIDNLANDINVNFQEAIEGANQKVLDLKAGARCTLNMASIIDDKIRFYNVGDSESLYLNSKGKKLFNSIPQSATGYKVHAGLYSQAKSLDEDERHVVYNVMGDKELRIESSSGFKMKKGHQVLIGSDGIFDNLSHIKLKEIMLKNSFEDGFKNLVELCLQPLEDWKKNDDVAFIYLKKT